MNDHILVFSFVTGRVGVWVELHVRGNGMPRDETSHGPDVNHQPDFVDLGDDAVDNFALERSEHNSLIKARYNFLVKYWSNLVFNRKSTKTPPRQDFTIANWINHSHAYHETMLTSTRSLNLTLDTVIAYSKLKRFTCITSAWLCLSDSRQSTWDEWAIHAWAKCDKTFWIKKWLKIIL